MEIEIITTKKKLSKAIVKQLEPAKFYDMQHFNTMSTIGYYVRDLSAKYHSRVGLFEGINGWKIIELFDWKESINKRRITYKNRYRDFETTEDRDLWLSEYNKLKDSCLKNHLIL